MSSQAPGQSERRANLAHLSYTCVEVDIDMSINVKVYTGHLNCKRTLYAPYPEKGRSPERNAEDRKLRSLLPTFLLDETRSGGTGKATERRLLTDSTTIDARRLVGTEQVTVPEATRRVECAFMWTHFLTVTKPYYHRSENT
ncbi:hypothetical protein E2C01_053495 [Portunus trituberculatus]|uniref:Uncharacterized protein n=1 Tax=Portunus trituberculatus TaxID=210409 RepID=A0A5B7GPL1_PORTR|nr:hypothetical protein [Portunus trituberculatus]